MAANPQNYMEELVGQYFENVAKETGCCTCARCKQDILCLALNQLRPKYITTEHGKEFAQRSNFDPQFESKVRTALIKSIQTVSKDPRHEK